MPKRHSDGRVCRKSNPRRRHLYLVMNDGVDGYAIRKFDLSMESDHDNDQRVAQRPPPALIRFDSSVSGFFAAIGSKILAMHSKRSIHVVPVFDVRTRCLTPGPCQRSCPSQPVYLAVGDKLVVLDEYSSGLLYPPFEGMDWTWLKLPNDPFMLRGITSYAVHPDGRTIFVSVKTATFSLDTESDDPKWSFHGHWKLPFTGRGHFDPVLNAWVGLSDTLGYLCSCALVDPDPCRNRQSPLWKLSKKKLLCVNLTEEHIGANLAYMGVRGFCLVQYFSIRDNDVVSISSQYRLRLTTFSLKYDEGDLSTNTPCRVRCYQLPSASKILGFHDPPAFWM